REERSGRGDVGLLGALDANRCARGGGLARAGWRALGEMQEDHHREPGRNQPQQDAEPTMDRIPIGKQQRLHRPIPRALGLTWHSRVAMESCYPHAGAPTSRHVGLDALSSTYLLIGKVSASLRSRLG